MAEQEVTTALAIPEQQQMAPVRAPRAISAFSSEEAFVAAQRMAKALSASTLVPAAYQNNIPNTLIAMELASRIGCSVFMAMQSLDVIQGRPSWRAQFLIATVNTSGRFTPLRFRWTGEPGHKTWGCIAYARDKQTGDMCEGAEITLGMAESEGWAKKSGTKWATMPQQMLMYRAAAFWARVYAPELSMGMHTADEVIDMQDDAPQLRQSAIDPPPPAPPEQEGKRIKPLGPRKRQSDPGPVPGAQEEPGANG